MYGYKKNSGKPAAPPKIMSGQKNRKSYEPGAVVECKNCVYFNILKILKVLFLNARKKLI